MYNSSVGLGLRPLRNDDERTFRALHQALGDEGVEFGLFFNESMTWSSYLAYLQSLRAEGFPKGRVRSALLIAEDQGQIVGRSSIRFALDDFLASEGGHIGYVVIPEFRRRGHATEILRQSMVIARAEGVERVLVTCDDDNVASARVIERCGGIIESLITGRGGSLKRRYWIE
jgi:predicted acetyltransferase